ncbi:MAG TPA: HD domain-containing protein [Phycisphaerae bacterium]|nr:HD domain-containing protein [Phycisphaerae bacterium]HOJ76036.1 HD domain-containing protein [Phycisphaerae bacterium]HOM53077.1 HD domain-containing protein [Phycisphaerae bacterium]HON69024.1 HD domain-containing protein [Phycisphaerae bacterium]HPP25838.1 HD domain-containing protein [Phycisphaerae bacterium]
MAVPQRTVLMVGDCREYGSPCRDRIREAGFRVVEGVGDDVLDQVVRRRPDLLAVALSPDADDAHTQIRAVRDDSRTSDTPILLLASGQNHRSTELALDAGADDYLTLPFEAREFRLRADRIIRTRRAQETARRVQARLRREIDNLTLLHQFYEQILTGDPETACRQSVETAARLTNSGRASMLLVDSQAHEMRFGHAVGIDPAVWQECRVPLSSPVAGRVMATRRELVVNGNTAWPRRDGYQHGQFISVPLVCGDPAEGNVLGVLNVTDHRDGLDYQPQDVLALTRLARAAAFAIDAVRTRRQLEATRDSIIFSLAKLSDYRHPSTGKHLERVRELSVALARQLARDPRVSPRIDGQFLSDLRRAAPLHDIGKVAVPDRILLKQGRLTETESAVMRDHTTIGAATLQSVTPDGQNDSFLKMAVEIAHYHHERYDGSGYPCGLAGDRIPLSARIVCLADSYDAIRTAREYKAARTHAEAAREVRSGCGTQFDPLVVEAFFSLEDQFERIYNNLMEDRAGRRRVAETPRSEPALA